MIGRREQVLIEKPGIGRTEGFTLVKLEGGVAGTIVPRLTFAAMTGRC